MRKQFDILVHGYDAQNPELKHINTKLMILTQTFILKSKRFDKNKYLSLSIVFFTVYLSCHTHFISPPHFILTTATTGVPVGRPYNMVVVP